MEKIILYADDTSIIVTNPKCIDYKLTMTRIFDEVNDWFRINLLKLNIWRNRPMQEVITFRNFKERDCATVAEHYRILPPLPFPRFASLHLFLGYVVITWSRNSKEEPRNLS
jgi:hypothetical protein